MTRKQRGIRLTYITQALAVLGLTLSCGSGAFIYFGHQYHPILQIVNVVCIVTNVGLILAEFWLRDRWRSLPDA